MHIPCKNSQEKIGGLSPSNRQQKKQKRRSKRMKKMRNLFIVLMLGCVSVAIANTEHRSSTNIDELARGQPVIDVGIVEVPSAYEVEFWEGKYTTTYGLDTSEGTLPGNIEVNRKERDVDSWRSLNINYNKSANKINPGRPSSEYHTTDDRVWRC